MALMSKGDLQYSDYSWTAYGSDNPKVTSEPDSTLFNRKEGYEVLYLINKFAEKHELKQKSSGQKAERMLHDHLPSDVRSQQNVMAWLANNWKQH
ncbi:hypothetical protein [Methylobacter marinus]|uniref:hypothetical protein n=1 Tax=Methylobacter marinus TaxID=34058 RepID=UPI00036B44A0|nr:hypothetical protein [Methylobacter marinus]